MAENNDVNPEEVTAEEISTSTLPLSNREEHPPLVVDLPDGQKLVVGDIKAGTVIEVATWRGVGRPDSRTHRFMLGVSYDEPEGLVTPTGTTPTHPTNSATQQLEVPTAANEPQRLTEKRDEFEENSSPKSSVSEPAVQQTESIPLAPTFIQTERLTSRTDLLFGANPITLNHDVKYFQPSNAGGSSQPGKELITSKKSSKLAIKVRSYHIPEIIVTVGTTLLIIFACKLAGISFIHPHSGLETAFGSAESTVMIVKEQSQYLVGDNVVADVTNHDENPVFGIIAAEGAGLFMLNGNQGYLSAQEEDIKGKVLAIAPWWGKIATLLRS